MKYRIYIFTIAVLFYQAQAQLCVSTGPTVVSNPLNGPYAPQVITSPVVTSPVVATTIVDNSVSNALANALQLLIVSDLIQSRLSSLLAPSALTNCLTPIFERTTPLSSPIIDVVTPCAASVDIIPPCVPVIETTSPICYGGVTETIAPNVFGYTETISCNPIVTETIVPNYCGGWTEAIVPTPCGITEIVAPNIAYGSNVATVVPNVCGGVTEVISPNPYVQIAGNNIYEVVPTCGPNFYGPEIISSAPCIPNYCGGIAEVLAPSFNPGCVGVAEVISSPFVNYYGGYPEVTSPQFNSPCISSLTEVISPNYYGGTTEVFLPYNPGCVNGLAEIISPISQFNSGCMNVAEILTPNPYSNCFGGMKELITPMGPFAPVGAEVVFPQSIPAQLTCNFGYMPTSVPCVSVNVEPLPFDTCSCGCNSFPKSFYF